MDGSNRPEEILELEEAAEDAMEEGKREKNCKIPKRSLGQGNQNRVVAGWN